MKQCRVSMDDVLQAQQTCPEVLDVEHIIWHRCSDVECKIRYMTDHPELQDKYPLLYDVVLKRLQARFNEERGYKR